MSRLSRPLALLFLIVMGLPAVAQAQGLSLLQRFGADGLPFTWDDPLAVGAGASPFRFVAMGGDACSEESALAENGARSAHGHGSGHPSQGDSGVESTILSHASRPAPDQLVENMITNAPFDFWGWVGAMNLKDAGMVRFRMFPEDTAWVEDSPSYQRGWGNNSWTSKESSGGIDQIWQGGSRARNLHLEALGLAYRDVKQPQGFAIAVKSDTLKLYPKFPSKLADAELNLFSEQAYLEGWVVEMVNLDNQSAAISGNFVADLAGLRITMKLDNISKQKMGCTATVNGVRFVIGGPVMEFQLADNEKKPSEFVEAKYVDDLAQQIADKTDISPVLCAIAAAFLVDIKEEARKEILKKIREEVDPIHALVGTEDFQVIGLYSGLAGRTRKNPFDKVALGTLEHVGQFQPHQWLAWKVVGDIPTAFDFDLSAANLQLQTSKTVLQGGGNDTDWRYNYGSTYLGKSGMLFGNSAGAHDKSTARQIPSDQAIHKTPDVLQSFAKQFVYLFMDVVDPHRLEVAERKAQWKSIDILFPKEARPGVTVDWPPPNFNFGRAHVVSMRSGSGGEITNANGSDAVGIDPTSALLYNFLACIDPESMTYSMAGSVQKRGAAPYDTQALARDNPPTPKANFGWTPPLPLPEQFPAGFVNDSGLRWLTAGTNRTLEAQSELRWAWDFELDGTFDSEHAQHMSDVGGAEFGAVFAFQPTSQDGAKGRTGFSLVPMTESARTALENP